MGIAPSYDFDKNVFVKQNLHKSYCLVLISATVCAFTYQQYYYRKNLLSTYMFSILVLDLLSKFIMILLCLVTTVSSAFWNMNEWRHLFQYFSAMEDYLKTGKTTEISFLKNFSFQFFLTNIVIISVLVSSFVPWFLYFKYSNPLIMTVEVFILYLQYVKFIKVTIVYNIALAIKCKYQDMNRHLIRGCCDRISEIPNVVKNVSHLYGLAGETVDTFNKLFGWEILLSIFHSTSMTLQCFNIIKQYYFKISDGPVSSTHLLILSITSMVSD